MEEKTYVPNRLLVYLSLIEGANQQRCIDLLTAHAQRFTEAPGSKTKHQAWPGGYVDHLIETMWFAQKLYDLMIKERTLPFTLSDAILVLFLHDKEKPFKYVASEHVLGTDEKKWKFLMKIVNDYQIELTSQHLNALRYVHGEGDDYDPDNRIMNELAQFVHMCDGASARIWYDYPKK